MYKETDAVTAFMQYKMGGKGYILHDNGEIWPFKDSFKQFDNARFIVDFPEEMKEPVTSGYIVPAEAETPEPASFTVAVTAETPEAKHRLGKRKADGQAEKEILEAWKGGDRSIKEIMEITGYSYPTVRKYISINEKG